MDANDLPQIDPNVDYNTILPIQQKRTVAFVNHFIMTTVDFLNNFANNCEMKLMNLEYKLQKIEASLIILETQLASIPDLNSDNGNVLPVNLPEVVEEPNAVIENESKTNEEDASNNESALSEPDEKAALKLKYFNLLRVGVPLDQLRPKMLADGLDPDTFNKPN